MKLNPKSAIVVFFFALFISCEKVSFHPSPCAIQQITTLRNTNDPGSTVVNQFTYNSWGAPLKVVTSFPITGNPNYEFKYDSKHRLTETDTYFSVGNLYTRTKYSYDRKDVIVADTTTSPDLPSFRSVTIYYYDSKFRISKLAFYTNNFFMGTREFKYDLNGNLDWGGAVTYDNKINIHRTNPVWMFLDRDYSINNPIPAGYTVQVRYNKKGLLTSYSITPPNGLAFNPSIVGHQANFVSYDCDERKAE